MSKYLKIMVYGSLLFFSSNFLYHLLWQDNFDGQALISSLVMMGILGLDKYMREK